MNIKEMVEMAKEIKELNGGICEFGIINAENMQVFCFNGEVTAFIFCDKAYVKKDYDKNNKELVKYLSQFIDNYTTDSNLEYDLYETFIDNKIEELKEEFNNSKMAKNYKKNGNTFYFGKLNDIEMIFDKNGSMFMNSKVGIDFDFNELARQFGFIDINDFFKNNTNEML